MGDERADERIDALQSVGNMLLVTLERPARRESSEDQKGKGVGTCPTL